MFWFFDSQKVLETNGKDKIWLLKKWPQGEQKFKKLFSRIKISKGKEKFTEFKNHFGCPLPKYFGELFSD